MKTKTDFVTNSSSVSFVVWGLNFEHEDITKEIGNELYNEYITWMEKYPDKNVDLKEDFLNDKSNIFDWVDILVIGSGLKMITDPWDDETYIIGRSPFDIKDDQTLAEFKEEIINQFRSIGFEVSSDELTSIEKCWEDR